MEEPTAQRKSRPRFKEAQSDDLTNVLLEHVRRPTTIDYVEEASAGVNSKLIRDNGLLVLSLEELQPNMAFPQKLMESCLLEVAQKKQKSGKWKTQSELNLLCESQSAFE